MYICTVCSYGLNMSVRNCVAYLCVCRLCSNWHIEKARAWLFTEILKIVLNYVSWFCKTEYCPSREKSYELQSWKASSLTLHATFSTPSWNTIKRASILHEPSNTALDRRGFQCSRRSSVRAMIRWSHCQRFMHLARGLITITIALSDVGR